MKKKILISAAALALVLCFAIGGTLAWLKDSASVENTFTFGDINITLEESDDLDLKMIPGSEIKKDPYVNVTTGSEECWLFVKIEKSDDFATFLSYAVAEGWTALDGEEDVYWREVKTADMGKNIGILAGDKVTVNEDATKEQFAQAGTVTMTFVAYAVQQANIDSVADAWEIAKN